MSIVNQITSTSSAKTIAQTAGVKGKITAGTEGFFGQTLTQSMHSESASSKNSALNLAGEPTLISFFSADDSDEGSLIKIVDLIFSEKESIDLALENNPEMLQNLQVLIQQMYSQLNGPQTTGSEHSAGMSEDLLVNTDLSEHPATARFILQDLMTQILTSMEGVKEGEAKHLSNFKQLIQQLQNQLQEAGVDLNKNEGWKMLNSLLSSDNPFKDSTTLARVEQPSLMGSQSLLNDAEFTTSEATVAETDGGIITAGELSLRSSGAKMLKPAEPVMQASNFAKEMTQFVVGKMDIVHKNGFSEAIISLRPEHLGKLDVQITLQNGQLVARFMTEHTMAKDLLEQQMMQLRTSLQSQGIQVERIEVTQNSSLGSHMYQDGGRQPGGHSQQQRRSREREDQSEDALTTASIQEELRNWRSDNEEGNEITMGSFSAEA